MERYAFVVDGELYLGLRPMTNLDAIRWGLEHECEYGKRNPQDVGLPESVLEEDDVMIVMEDGVIKRTVYLN